MDPHIIPSNHSAQVKKSHHQWHFEASLFGAAILLLLIPSMLFPMNPPQKNQVLGVQTESTIAARAYDSELGYFMDEDTPIENENIFTIFIKTLQSLFN